MSVPRAIGIDLGVPKILAVRASTTERVAARSDEKVPRGGSTPPTDVLTCRW